MLLLVAVGLALGVGIAAALTQAPGVPVVQGATKVTICHATASATNPYVQLEVDDDAIVKPNGHGEHPDDIIPPFDYVDQTFDYVDQSQTTQHSPSARTPARRS